MMFVVQSCQGQGQGVFRGANRLEVLWEPDGCWAPVSVWRGELWNRI